MKRYLFLLLCLAVISIAIADENSNYRDIKNLTATKFDKSAVKNTFAHASSNTVYSSKLENMRFANYTNSIGGKVPYNGAAFDVDLNNKHLVNISHLGIGTSLTPDIILQLVGDNGTYSRMAMRGYSNDSASSAIMVTKFRGTTGTPLTVASGDSLGAFQLAGYSSLIADGIPGAYIEAKSTENWSSTKTGTYLNFNVTPTGTTGPQLAMSINQDKTVTASSGFHGPVFGNASSAGRLKTTPSTCSGQAATGVDAYGNATGCYTPAGTYSLPTATASVLGGVKPDGTSILNTAGVISATATSVGAAATNQTMYIGTTPHAINRASASEPLTGITSIDGTASNLTTTWTTPTFSAGDYTSDTGAWTVASGNVVTFRYIVVGKMMTVLLTIESSTITGTPGVLHIKIPGGYTSTKSVWNLATDYNGSAYETCVIRVLSSATLIDVYRYPNFAAWGATAGSHILRGEITFEVN